MKDSDALQLPSVSRPARHFPAVLTFSPEEYAKVSGDPHTLFVGDRARTHLLYEMLDQRRGILEAAGHDEHRVHETLLHILHGFFVGDVGDASRAMAPMYDGTPADFDRDMELWRLACENVHQTFDYVLRALPPTLTFGSPEAPTSIRVGERLKLAWETASHDPLDLLERARSAPPCTSVWHFARTKLGIAQFMFEAIRNGYAPETLERQRQAIDAFLGRRLFAAPMGTDITVIAELDSENEYRCTRFEQLNGRLPNPISDGRQRSLSAHEFTIKLPEGREIKVWYASRSKRHLFLKALTKDFRFLPINGFGDSIGLMFVVEEGDLDDFVRMVRPILVPCPGSVSDQNSTIGHRNGRANDPKNPHTSHEYEVMKYNALVGGRVIEVQFVPKKAWINARCAHSDVNHWHYKMRQLLERILPVLFPPHVFGIPWDDPSVREQCFAHAITLED